MNNVTYTTTEADIDELINTTRFSYLRYNYLLDKNNLQEDHPLEENYFTSNLYTLLHYVKDDSIRGAVSITLVGQDETEVTFTSEYNIHDNVVVWDNCVVPFLMNNRIASGDKGTILVHTFDSTDKSQVWGVWDMDGKDLYGVPAAVLADNLTTLDGAMLLPEKSTYVDTPNLVCGEFPLTVEDTVF